MNKIEFTESLKGYSVEQLEQELAKRAIQQTRCVVVKTIDQGDIPFSVDTNGNLLIGIGGKQNRICCDDVEKLLILFELVTKVRL